MSQALFILVICQVCGIPFERPLGVKGRPREMHEKCGRFETSLRMVESLVEEIEFSASEDSIQAQRRMRGRLWSAANMLNGTAANGGSNHNHVVHLTEGSGVRCRKTLLRPDVTTDPEKVTCRQCLIRIMGGPRKKATHLAHPHHPGVAFCRNTSQRPHRNPQITTDVDAVDCRTCRARITAERGERLPRLETIRAEVEIRTANG